MDLTLLIIVAIVAILLGALIGGLVSHSRSNRYLTKAEMLEQDKSNLMQDIKDKSNEILTLRNDKTSLLSERASLQTEVDNLNQKIIDFKDSLSSTKKQYEDIFVMKDESEAAEEVQTPEPAVNHETAE